MQTVSFMQIVSKDSKRTKTREKFRRAGLELGSNRDFLENQAIELRYCNRPIKTEAIANEQGRYST